MTKVLDGVHVIELGTMITAPLAGMMLADLGADVIKVEQPTGDPFRSYRGSFYSPHFTAYNRGKRSLTLDLKSPAGRKALRKLIMSADVLIDNFRPGVFEKLGFSANGLKEINPRLIYCSITGFGTSGPYCNRPAFDTVGMALSGIASLLIDPQEPQVVGPTIPDNVTGIFACYGILGALYERERTGRGRRVEVNMIESAIAFVPDPFANARAGMVNGPLTRVANSQAFTFRCLDDKILAVHLSTQPKFWEGMTRAIERPDLLTDSRFFNHAARIDHFAELTQLLANIFATRTRADWIILLEESDVPFAPAHTIQEVAEDPQVQHLQTFRMLHHPTEGDMLSIRRPVRIDGERDGADLAAPTLGQHTEEILRELDEMSMDD